MPVSTPEQVTESANYGSLGPDADVSSHRPVVPSSSLKRPMVAVLVGMAMALPFVMAGRVRAAWNELATTLSLHGKSVTASPSILSRHEIESLNNSSSQEQASLLLERAINHYEGSTDEIASRVDTWTGKLTLTPQLNSLITTALNSNDLRVRATAIEVDLAAMNVKKTAESFDAVASQAESGVKTERVWALWTIGLLANRGINVPRAFEILTGSTRDSDPDIRQWAVEGLGYLGTDETIAPLLAAFHDDASPVVRERAGCSLAQSGMLTEKQRRSAIPQLLSFADDTSLDAQTHTWVFHALRDITAQNLPDDAVAWKNWYSNSGG
jgi:HEAT repeat protein